MIVKPLNGMVENVHRFVARLHDEIHVFHVAFDLSPHISLQDTPCEYLLSLFECTSEMDKFLRLKMRKEDALLYPPPNLYDYEEGARGPGTAPAIWFKRCFGSRPGFGVEYDDSENHRAYYAYARLRWRHSMLLASPKPWPTLSLL